MAGGMGRVCWLLSATNATATSTGGANTDSNHLDLIAGIWIWFWFWFWLLTLNWCIIQKDNLAACGNQLDDLFALSVRSLLAIGITVSCLMLQTSRTIQSTVSLELLLLAVQAALLLVMIEK